MCFLSFFFHPFFSYSLFSLSFKHCRVPANRSGLVGMSGSTGTRTRVRKGRRQGKQGVWWSKEVGKGSARNWIGGLD